MRDMHVKLWTCVCARRFLTVPRCFAHHVTQTPIVPNLAPCCSFIDVRCNRWCAYCSILQSAWNGEAELKLFSDPPPNLCLSFLLRVISEVTVCCTERSAIMPRPSSSESSRPHPPLCVTLCRPYQSWWQWCVSLCLCTGCTLSAAKGNSKGDHMLCVCFSRQSTELQCLCGFKNNFNRQCFPSNIA